jgi:hypothetical protein
LSPETQLPARDVKLFGRCALIHRRVVPRPHKTPEDRTRYTTDTLAPIGEESLRLPRPRPDGKQRLFSGTVERDTRPTVTRHSWDIAPPMLWPTPRALSASHRLRDLPCRSHNPARFIPGTHPCRKAECPVHPIPVPTVPDNGFPLCTEEARTKSSAVSPTPYRPFKKRRQSNSLSPR